MRWADGQFPKQFHVFRDQLRLVLTDASFPVSVVVAAWPDTAGLIQCLDALQLQSDELVQIFVVSPLPAPTDLGRNHPAVQWLVADSSALIPNLWSIGMAAATGEVIAITTAHFLPAPDWIAQIRAAHRRFDSAGIGGPIDPPRGGSLGDWATYFLRYSTAFIYQDEQTVHDLIGDNASYQRSALQAHWESIRVGFWEPEFHRRVLAEGRKLTFVPAIRITQKHSFGISRFCSQRLNHGRHYGRDRMRGKPALLRVAGIVLAPLIPFVLLAKIMARLLHKPAYMLPFLASLPVLLLFIGSWALGELWGYLSRATPDGPSLGATGHLSA